MSLGHTLASLFIALRALLYMTGFILLWGYVALAVRSLDRRFGLALAEGVRLPGIMLMAAGFLLVALCAWSFVIRGRGTPALFDPPRVFVPTGPYRYVRNPMYLGAWVVLAGFGLARRSGSILLFSLALLFLTHLFVFFIEEPGLRERFGDTYLRYTRSTPRWIPRLRRRET